MQPSPQVLFHIEFCLNASIKLRTKKTVFSYHLCEMHNAYIFLHSEIKDAYPKQLHQMHMVSVSIADIIWSKRLHRLQLLAIKDPSIQVSGREPKAVPAKPEGRFDVCRSQSFRHNVCRITPNSIDSCANGRAART